MPTNVLQLPLTTGNVATTPDSAANSITGDIDIRMKLSLVDWQPAVQQGIASKYGSSGASRAWRWYFNGGGSGAMTLEIANPSNVVVGVTTGIGFPAGADTVRWVRVTWRASDGRVQFFTSDDGASWTQFYSDMTIALSAIRDTDANLAVGAMSETGASPLQGNVYYFQLRNGIGGTVVQSFDATTVTRIGTRNPSTVTAGGPWTISGSAWDWVSVADLGGWGVGQIRMGA